MTPSRNLFCRQATTRAQHRWSRPLTWLKFKNEHSLTLSLEVVIGTTKLRLALTRENIYRAHHRLITTKATGSTKITKTLGCSKIIFRFVRRRNSFND